MLDERELQQLRARQWRRSIVGRLRIRLSHAALFVFLSATAGAGVVAAYLIHDF
jgi:hypothetical protein